MRGWAVEQAEDATRLARRPGSTPGAAASAAWAEAETPADAPVYRVALAHQVRQDLWRALREVRGFSPVVEVRTGAGPQGFAVEITAGAAEGAAPGAGAQVRAAAAALLASSPHRRRWHAWALRRAAEHAA